MLFCIFFRVFFPLSCRSPEDLYQAYNSSGMILNPDFSDISGVVKKINIKRSRVTNEEERWKNSSLNPAIEKAMEFTEHCTNDLLFHLPLLQDSNGMPVAVS